MKLHLPLTYLRIVVAIAVSFLLSSSFTVYGQACQFQQGQNGGVGLPVESPVQFERGNSNGSKSHFAEGYSVPYRIEFTTLEANQQYRVRIAFDVKKNEKVSFDYITGFQNLQLRQSLPSELVDPLVGTGLASLSGISSSFLAIPAPTFTTNTSFNSTASASFSQLKTAAGLNPETSMPTSPYSASLRNKGNMVIWNATLNSIQYVGGVDISPATVSVAMDVVFTKANNANNVVLAWGGHIASLLDWGVGNSASSIPGSPYHMYVETVVKTSDGDVICNGNMDCQIAADAVTPVPTCNITGPSELCSSTTLVNYKAVLDASQNGPVSYNWSVVDLSSSSTAQLSGSGAGVSSIDTLLQAIIPSDSFLVRLRVQRGGIFNYCYLNSVDSPGTKVKKLNVEVQAQAMPTVISLNSASTSQLNATIQLNGSIVTTGFNYQWTIVGPGGFASGSLDSYSIPDPVFTASMAGDYTLKVIASQQAAPNCVDSATIVISVGSSQGCPSLLTQSLCNASQLSFPVSSLPQPDVDYSWSVTNGASILNEGGDSLLTVLAGAQDFDITLQLSYANPLLNNLVCTYPVIVHPLPVLTLGSYGPTCVTASALSLSGLPAGGTWSGSGVSGSTFTPSVAGAGTIRVYYSYTDENGCSSVDSTEIVVNEIPRLDPGTYGPLCVSASPVFLQGTPAGGTWSGTGVSGSTFDPSVAGVGTHAVNYSVTITGGCVTDTTIDIRVNPLPVLTLGSYGPTCVTASPLSLSGLPAGGTWSGSGVSGSTYTPSVAGAGTIRVYYSYTDENGCSSVDSTEIVVNEIPRLDPGTYGPLCVSASPVFLQGTPAGGTWSGTGVSGSTFDPSVAGVGTHAVNYSVTITGGCVTDTTIDIRVNPLPVLTLGSYGPTCVTASALSLSGLPAGGTWSGSGVSGSMFTPSVAGAGTIRVYYSYTDENGCSSVDSTEIVVNEIPRLDPGTYGPLCVSASSISLSGLPAGGTWGGTGVSGSTFDPSVAGVGTHAVNYSVTITGGCVTDTTIDIRVNPLPVLTLGSYGPTCVTASALSLSGLPAGGTWSGSGVSGSTFTPSVAGAGTIRVYYSYTDENGCSSVDSTEIVVNEIPRLDPGTYGPLCVSASSISLSGLPAGGTWSGTGVSGSTFDPSVAGVGTHAVNYSVTITGGCVTDTTIDIRVNPLPVLTLGSYGPTCVTASPLSLSGLPAGGTWIGSGVSGSTFTPSVAGAGTIRVYYSYTDENGCSSVDSTEIVVNEIPSLDPGTYGPLCVSASSISLSGLPAGGTWSGTGVSGSTFDPSVAGVGTHAVNYSVTITGGCVTDTTIDIRVNPLPVLTLGSYGPTCVTASPLSLSGLPAGGTWSGSGVSGSTFTPSVAGAGTIRVYYSYTDENGCSSVDSTEIVVNEIPRLDPGTYGPLCVSASPVFLQGTPAGGTWSGTGVSGSTFDPSVAGVGTHAVNYSVTITGGCVTDTTIEIEVKPLPNLDLGTYEPLCEEDEIITLTATPTGGTWSGTGTIGSTFNPALAGLGVHVLTYHYTDAFGCSAVQEVSIQVNRCAGINACTLTQGYYGSSNGKSCDEDSLYRNAVSIIKKLLTPSPIVIGSGARTLTITVADSARLNAVMPGGGTPFSFSHTGNITLQSSQFSLYKTSRGKINNILLSQTIALALNVRIKPDLAPFVLENGYIHTQRLRTCQNADLPSLVTCEEDSMAIRAWLMIPSVVNYLQANSGGTVADLLALANEVLGRTKVPGQAGAGGTVVPSLANIVAQVDIINNAFDQCRIFLGFFPTLNLCTSSSLRAAQQEEAQVSVVIKTLEVKVFPNPFGTTLNFNIQTPEKTKVTIELFDLQGKLLTQEYIGEFQSQENRIIQMKAPVVSAPILYRVTTSKKVFSGVLLPSR